MSQTETSIFPQENQKFKATTKYLKELHAAFFSIHWK